MSDTITPHQPVNTPTYTLDDAVKIAKELEPVFASRGMHIAIGGSLVYRGTSSKDIDIFIYPHNKEVVMDRVEIVVTLSECGFHAVKNYEKDKGHTMVPDVHVTQHESTDQRVDFFFLSRHTITQVTA